MDALRLKNFRCLEDTGEIEIKPLTFLVGANSSGKSSFLKFFPLLKQSLGVNKRGFFLWNGPTIDFMDFQNTVRDGEKEMEISFSFRKVKTNPYNITGEFKDGVDIKLTVVICDDGKHYDSIETTKIEISGQTILIKFNGKGIRQIIVGGVDSTEYEGSRLLAQYTVALFPNILFITHDKGKKSINSIREEIKKIQVEEKIEYFNDVDLTYSRRYDSKDFIKARIKEKYNKTLPDDKLDRLFDLNFFNNLNSIIFMINENILQMARNMAYMGPLRESTERYYRFQNIDIDEINADGSNLAMYLYNLAESQKVMLNKWLKDNFDFQIGVVAEGGHVNLMIKEGEKKEKNLVDVGFGYTQILPILVDIWKTQYVDKDVMRVGYHKDVNQKHIIAIEQPELHLHPRFQAMFADLLIKTINYAYQNDKDIRIVIETHSEKILNKIGEGIAQGKLDRSCVNVVLFNAKDESLKKYVEIASFDEDGFLTNWPIGFFEEK